MLKMDDLGGGPWQHVRSIGNRVATRSILNPLHWLCFLLGLFTIVGALVHAHLMYLGGALFLAAVLLDLVAYVYFAFTDPNRLQSEEHQQTMYQMQHLVPQDDRGKIPEAAANVAYLPHTDAAEAEEAGS